MFIGKKLSRHFGTGFLAVEYPGYPLSREGTISEKNAYEVGSKHETIGLRDRVRACRRGLYPDFR